MLTYKKDDFDESLEDIMKTVNEIINQNQEKDDAVTLMTMHSAKGLEYRVVFLIGMEEGIFPHQNSFFEEGGIEEERRLCYVGITRAKERLYLSNAKRRRLYGNDQVNMPSRFIKEIDPELLDIVGVKEEPVREVVPIKSMYKDASDDFKSGDIINHTSYGKGVVIAVEKEIITVAFDKKTGIKKLLKNHKGITKL